MILVGIVNVANGVNFIPHLKNGVFFSLFVHFRQAMPSFVRNKVVAMARTLQKKGPVRNIDVYINVRKVH